MAELAVFFMLFLAGITGIGVAAGWYLNLITLCLCTGVYVAILLRSDWPEFFKKRGKNYLDYGDFIVPLLPLTAAWITAAYVRGFLNPAGARPLQAFLRQVFLR